MKDDKVRARSVIISGICGCGHHYEDHHLSFIMNKEYWQELKEINPDHPAYVPGECLYYGCNETGGLKLNEETGEWEDHCFQYRDQEDQT